MTTSVTWPMPAGLETDVVAPVDLAAVSGSVEFIGSLLHLCDPSVGSSTALATRHNTAWEELTYSDLEARSAQVRDWLRGNGVNPGDRVALLGESGGAWVAALLGMWRAGAVAVPLDPALTEDELADLAGRAPFSAIVVSRRSLAAVADLATPPESAPAILVLDDIATCMPPAGADVHRDMSDLALLVWTSGTTGRPKGVCLTFANLDYVVTQSVAEQRATQDDSWLSVLSLNHMLELSCGLLACLRTGATMSFARSQMPDDVVSAISERKVTRMMVVPLLLRLLQRRLARTPQVASHLRALFSGGAPLDPELLRSYDALGIPVYQGYGLTELAPAVAMNSARGNRAGSVGRPLPGTEVRTAEAEILVRSPALMTGYWGDAETTAAAVDGNGWFHTGDLGYLDTDGYLYITGRTKNLIVLESGKKVSPEEVEAALCRSGLFAEICVVGLPGAGRRGADSVCAVVVPTPDLRARVVDDEELAGVVEAEVRRCSQVLSGYKRPTCVRLELEPLPKTIKLSLRRADVLELVQRRGETR